MYSIFDAHCDTMNEILDKGENIIKNNLHIDFERMKQYDKYVQIFAAFVDKKSITVSPKERVGQIIEVYRREIENSPICHCESYEQLERESYCSLLGIEGGEAIEGSLETLEKFYCGGVRIMTLTWNYRNEIADGITESDGRGLTDFGKSVVKKMNKLGMVVDVSHLSEKGFWDVYKTAEKPFIVSHSDAKALCAHPRNLNDEQIKAVIECGGVIGINFYPEFLDNSGKCTIERICDHIDYMIELGGENNIGFGSDFDGVEYLPDGVTGIECMDKIIEMLKARGYSDRTVKKIAFDNFLRVLRTNFE